MRGGGGRRNPAEHKDRWRERIGCVMFHVFDCARIAELNCKVLKIILAGSGGQVGRVYGTGEAAALDSAGADCA